MNIAKMMDGLAMAERLVLNAILMARRNNRAVRKYFAVKGGNHMLTKQQKLAVLSKAIDEGASIDIHFHKLPKENHAKRIINEIGEVTGLTTTHHENSGHQWYKVAEKGFDVAAFYDKEEVKI